MFIMQNYILKTVYQDTKYFVINQKKGLNLDSLD
jgi:hypothetical protein